MEKLLLIQSELKAPKNQFNAFGKYKYRNCEDILEAVKPLLLKHECTLTITDKVIQFGETLVIEATVSLAESKTTATSSVVKVSAHAGIDVNRKGMDIAQSFGASSSYARKYALNGLFLIDDTKDADATNTHGKEPEKEKPTLNANQLKDAVKAIQDGKKDAVQKQLEKYALTPEQKSVIDLTIKNL